MIWLGMAGAVVAVVAVVMLVARARTSRRGAAVDEPVDEVDPLFTMGIVLTGAGVALAVTLGQAMYAMFTIGLIMMAVGAHRTSRRRQP